MMPTPPNRAASDRSRVKRIPDRGVYDVDTIHRILDEGIVCHVGLVVDNQPFVIPMAYVRIGDRICLHGSPASRTLKALASGAEVCITVTLLDGLVLARSAFHHSMNYRSAVLFGKGTEIVDKSEKVKVLHALSDHLIPGRWQEIRGPNENELKQTMVVAVPIDEVSAKVRTGGPRDDEEDMGLSMWAGVVPLQMIAMEPIADALLKPGIDVPSHARAYPGPSETWIKNK
jgi:nitroimidazol reductase NimA-like FMN-containing flavoprotein (pyridoxamine 5'-phosphate oxidase superfamily)